MDKSNSRIEKEDEIKCYLSKLKYILEKEDTTIYFQIDRHVDLERDFKYTNRYTVGELFPDEAPIIALRRELLTLTIENYIQTVKDLKRPNLSEMREFGKAYDGYGDVYIKIRVELLSKEANGNHTAFVMSFHFAERPFTDTDFPYKK